MTADDPGEGQRAAEPMDPREDMLHAYAAAARTGVHHPQSAAVAIAWAVSEIDRLRAELADLRAAGDALADAAAETSGWSGLPSALWAPLAEARDAWRSVRGDAPTQPPTVCAHPELDGSCSGCAPADEGDDR